MNHRRKWTWRDSALVILLLGATYTILEAISVRSAGLFCVSAVLWVLYEIMRRWDLKRIEAAR